MKLETLNKLYINELRDLYNAENQLLKALPKMAKAASSAKLRKAFQTHLEQTEGHVERLEQVFKELGEKAKGKTCHGMKGLIEEGSEILEEEGDESVLDGPLDDNQYPDYHNGFVPGGIHFNKGCQHVDGEHALRLARSREAIQPSQASDFGRARRHAPGRFAAPPVSCSDRTRIAAATLVTRTSESSAG